MAKIAEWGILTAEVLMPPSDIALGLDIGGTRIQAGLVDTSGNVLRPESSPHRYAFPPCAFRCGL